jgi:hypothetical protein
VLLGFTGRKARQPWTSDAETRATMRTRRADMDVLRERMGWVKR